MNRVGMNRVTVEGRAVEVPTHTTAKFAKVVPISMPDLPREPGEVKKVAASSSPPAWQDPPTLRGSMVALPTTVTAGSPQRALLTVLVGLDAGRVFTLGRAETVIGRGHAATISIDESGVSRRHAVVRRMDGDRYVLQDLGSANGTFVNERRVERADLVNGDRVQVGPATVLRFGLTRADEEALARQLYESSTRDALTHLYNRRYASERLRAEIAYAERHGTQVSVLLFDLDHFKRTNDTFGHAAGDAVLRVVAAEASKAVRAEDVVARYGGEEFLVLVRGVSPENVRVLAERLRRAIEGVSIPWGSETLNATVSVGVASLSECRETRTADALVSLADGRLYRAKAAGRNQVC